MRRLRDELCPRERERERERERKTPHISISSISWEPPPVGSVHLRAQDKLYGSPLGQPELKSDGWHRRFQKCHVFVSALAEKSEKDPKQGHIWSYAFDVLQA